MVILFASSSVAIKTQLAVLLSLEVREWSRVDILLAPSRFLIRVAGEF
ncbi:hypothetical protein CIPAW_05G177800 [Carya illinoinensis]|uniref:Uncharacterized protein n=1 Tax=Carya illinoinensis TaxID=32201 RepID=A0A8T1QJH4_CARIL|nr:hypothetical protein CIPAW_05G177800 [Carya illinoinensis]